MLTAGAAKRALKFPESFFPHRSFRGRYFTGIHDELHVRALYLEKDGEAAVLAGIDCGDVSETWKERLARELGMEKKSIFLFAAHSHAAPHLGGTWPEDVTDAEQGDCFAEMAFGTLTEAVRDAMASKREAKAAYGVGHCDINVNRDRLYRAEGEPERYIQAPAYGRPADERVKVLRVTDRSGKNIAVLANYAVHSNVTFCQTWNCAEGMLISADLGGCAATYAEEKCGGVVLYSMGAAADMMPKQVACGAAFDSGGRLLTEWKGREAGFAMLKKQAETLGKAITDACALAEPCADDGPLSCTAVTVEHMGKVKDGDRKKRDDDAPAEEEYIPTVPLEMELGLLQTGGITVAAVPAEIVSSIGRETEEKLGDKVVVISQCGGSFSYISDDWGYGVKTFEAQASHFMPGAGHKIAEAFAEA